MSTPPYPPSGSATPLPPLFKADTATLTFARSVEGKIRVTYSGWDDAKVVPAGGVFELSLGPQGVEGRIVTRNARGHPFFTAAEGNRVLWVEPPSIVPDQAEVRAAPAITLREFE